MRVSCVSESVTSAANNACTMLENVVILLLSNGRSVRQENIIRLIRRFGQISQTELADQLGVCQQLVSRWETADEPQLPDRVIPKLAVVARKALDKRRDDRAEIREVLREDFR